jgi:hypothetical protein
MKRPLPLCAIAGLISCLTNIGCSDNWQAETQPASGRVSINGQPPVGALVQLYPAGEKVDVRNSRPWGLVGNDGAFALSTYESGDGAPTGEYKFTIIWPVDPSSPAPTDRLNYQYSRPEQSTWSISIQEGENLLPPVDITGAKVLTKEQASAPRQAPPTPGMAS